LLALRMPRLAPKLATISHAVLRVWFCGRPVRRRLQYRRQRLRWPRVRLGGTNRCLQLGSPCSCQSARHLPGRGVGPSQWCIMPGGWLAQRPCTLLVAPATPSCSAGTWVRDRHAGASCRCLRTSAARPLAAPPVPAMLFVSSTAAATIGVARIPAPQFGPATLFYWAGVAFLPVAQL
jgi:hypothetical protein